MRAEVLKHLIVFMNISSELLILIDIDAVNVGDRSCSGGDSPTY